MSSLKHHSPVIIIKINTWDILLHVHIVIKSLSSVTLANGNACVACKIPQFCHFNHEEYLTDTLIHNFILYRHVQTWDHMSLISFVFVTACHFLSTIYEICWFSNTVVHQRALQSHAIWCAIYPQTWYARFETEYSLESVWSMLSLSVSP